MIQTFPYRELWCVLFLFICSVGTAHAQNDLRYDPARRIYTLVYEDNDGIRRTTEIIPPNRIEPEINLIVEWTAERIWSYEYTIANRPGPFSTQAIFKAEIDCPSADAILSIMGSNRWGGSHGFDQWHQRFFCEFVTGVNDVYPGDSILGLRIESSLLPHTTEGRFWGARVRPEPLINTSERPELSQLRGRATGALGGWFELRIVAPGRSPEELADPVSGTNILVADLAETCDLAWITNPGVCNSLRTKLEQAGRTLERGRNEAAVGQLQAFLNELEAQHGEEPGKHVNDNAYWLLKINVEFILERMAAGEA